MYSKPVGENANIYGCDFQHCGILTVEDLDEPVQPLF